MMADAVVRRAVRVLDPPTRRSIGRPSPTSRRRRIFGRLAARVGLLHRAEPVAGHPLARLRELHDVVLVARLVLQRRVHGLPQPIEQLPYLVVLQRVSSFGRWRVLVPRGSGP